MNPPFVRLDDGLLIAVRLTPRSGRDAIEGVGTMADGASHLRARVRAVPEGGAANAALIALFAKRLRIAKSAITLASGASSRQKKLKVEGNPNELAERLQPLMSTGRSEAGAGSAHE